jgi:hypothetical protein
MLVPKRDEHVTANDPHGGLYHVPELGTSCHAELSVFPRDCLVLFLVPLSKPHPWAAAVLVDELDQTAQTRCATMRPSRDATSLDL